MNRSPSDTELKRGLALLEASFLESQEATGKLRTIKPTKVMFAARDTGRRILVELGGGRLRCRLDGGSEFDVIIEATEETLAGIMTGERDADAEFFSGRLSVRGSLAAAFLLRTKLLGLVQACAARVEITLGSGRARAGCGADSGPGGSGDGIEKSAGR